MFLVCSLFTIKKCGKDYMKYIYLKYIYMLIYIYAYIYIYMLICAKRNTRRTNQKLVRTRANSLKKTMRLGKIEGK